MKYKWTEEEHKKLDREIKDFAKKSIKELWSNKLTLKGRVINCLNALSIYAFFAVTWAIRVYRGIRWLEIKLGINIKWVIIILISVWTLANILHEASQY